jgi:hypothetical protein
MKDNNIIMEQYYITAINNLLRQINYLELQQQLITNQIDEVQFNKELETHPNKYIITINDISIDKSIILNILSKIDISIRELSVNDIGELFSTTY